MTSPSFFGCTFTSWWFQPRKSKKTMRSSNWGESYPQGFGGENSKKKQLSCHHLVWNDGIIPVRSNTPLRMIQGQTTHHPKMMRDFCFPILLGGALKVYFQLPHEATRLTKPMVVGIDRSLNHYLPMICKPLLQLALKYKVL